MLAWGSNAISSSKKPTINPSLFAVYLVPSLDLPALPYWTTQRQLADCCLLTRTSWWRQHFCPGIWRAENILSISVQCLSARSLEVMGKPIFPPLNTDLLTAPQDQLELNDESRYQHHSKFSVFPTSHCFLIAPAVSAVDACFPPGTLAGAACTPSFYLSAASQFLHAFTGLHNGSLFSSNHEVAFVRSLRRAP